MKILPRLILIAGFLTGVNAWATDTYDSTSNQLTIPTVQVGSTTYTNVVISVGNVLSIGNSPANGYADIYNSTNGQLMIPSVLVGSTTYNNVIITVSSVLSLGGSFSNPRFSVAGVWQAVSTPYISATNSGGHTSSYANLNLFQQLGQSIVLSGWSVNSSGFSNAGAITPIQVGLLVYQTDGSLSLQTNQYISNTTTNGCWLPLIADFNGDGISDIFLGAHNEMPLVASASTALISNANGTYSTKTVSDSIMMHQGNLTVINGQPVIFGADFGPSPTVYQFNSVINNFTVNTVNTVNPNNSSYGDSNVVGDFLGDGTLQYVNGDVGYYAGQQGPILGSYQPILVESMSSSFITNAISPLAILSPYFNNSQYSSYFSGTSDNRVLEPRLWSDDFNHDGKLDIVALSGIWSPTINWSLSTIQMLQNKGNNIFADVTDKFNSGFDTASQPDYEMQMQDIDHSGINSYLVGMTSSGSSNAINQQGNYLLVNDGTGKTYVALHDQFVALGQQVLNYANSVKQENGIGWVQEGIPTFRGYLDASGYLNYVADIGVDSYTTGRDIGQNLFINVPIHYAPATNFTQNITITDRNQSKLMRTWAGNDVIMDTNANAAPAHIDGGLGVNTAVYSDVSANYSMKSLGTAGYEVKHTTTNAFANVDDTLINIQYLKFSDTNLTLPFRQ